VRVRRIALLLAVLAGSLVLLTLQARGQLSAGGQVVSVVAAPLQTVVARINRASFGLWSTYREWKNVLAENVRLRAENDRLRVDALRVADTDDENRRLRRLLTLRDRLPLTTLPGEVIAREGGWARSLTVNRGLTDEITRMTPAIVPEGLVGRVVEVRRGTSVVKLLNDPASSVGATLQRTRTVGVVEGDPRGTMRFKYHARDGLAIQVGDLVVTSGAGGVFPKGIPIGRVQTIDDRGSALFHYAAVTPMVDFSRLEEVLLVTGRTAADLALHFTPGG
jgi:rod shape-determining protein MreC